MKTTDLFRTSAKKLNEGLSKTFGKKIDFASFDTAKLEDARNKLRTQVHQIRSESGFNENIDNDAYHEAQWMLDAINAEIAEREELLAAAGTAEVEEEADIENMDEVHDIFRRYQGAAEEGEYGDAWGDPDMEQVMSLVSAGKLEAAAEEFVNAFADRDGDEVKYGDNMYEDLLNDLKAELDATEESTYSTTATTKDGQTYSKTATTDAPVHGKKLSAKDYPSSDKGLPTKDSDEKFRPTEEGASTLDAIGAAVHKLVKGDKQEKPAVVTAPAKKPTKHKEKPLMPPEHTDEDVASHDNMGFSDKEIKMAYGILNDPRYKQGNLTGAAEKIEQIAKGLTKHPGVQRAMRATQESIELGDEMTNITEGEVQQASAIVTAKTMVDRISRFIEELSSMENETLLQLGDSIRDEIGEQQSKSFIEGSAPSIQQALETLKGTRDTLSQAVNTLATGEAPADMLGAEPTGEEPAADMGGDMEAPAEAPAEDEFAAAEPAAGGMEAAGREQRESIQRQNDLMTILAG